MDDNDLLRVLEEREKAVQRLFAVPMVNDEHRFRCLAAFLSIDALNNIAQQWEQST